MKKIILILIIFANSTQNTFSSEKYPKTKLKKTTIACMQHEFTSEQWRKNLKHLGIHHQGYNGLTALHAAVRDKDTSFLKELLSTEGVRVDSTCFCGGTPLGVAVEQGDTDATKLLLEAGANPDAKNEAGFSPLNIALYRLNKISRDEFSRLLITKTALNRQDLEKIEKDAIEWRKKQLGSSFLNK